ncbi:MAG: amidase [Rhodospirillales bacterium]|nr:amidase [Rhodospirillales bacterium]
MPNKTIQDLDAELSAGRVSARALVDAALARAADPAGEGSRVFIKLWAEEARRAADAQDLLRKNGAAASPLAGIPVSLKDLFDVAGETTLAGSKALRDAAPARKDAAIVQRLKAAGAVLVGRTNMTEFAFSAIGHNPHYGTPGNPWDRARVPGGSSSGAAVSVADGMCVAAIGSDTGGSVRIPAALCGLAGFKPTQARVPLEGALPLSTTLDSIGPLARSIADCALVDAILAGEPPSVPEPIGPAGLHLAVPKTLVLDDLDRDVGTSFERALGALSRAGARITEIDMPELREVVEANAKGGFSPVEALAWHEELLASRGEEYDPRVRTRIERGRSMTGADYVRLGRRRAELVARAGRTTEGYDALVLPTCAIIAPRMDEIAEDEGFWKRNALLLRNTSLFNFLDRCAATLPMHRPGDAPTGLMLVGPRMGDRRLLAVARGCEGTISSA